MLFNSPIFIFVFFPITYLVFWALSAKNGRYIWLTVTGYVFYGWWNPKYCFLMLFSTLVSFTTGLYLASQPSKKKKLQAITLAIAIDLTLLGFFKYYNFLAGSTNTLLHHLGSFSGLPLFKILLPIGISFYTFHTISYVVDSYRGTIKPTKNFFEFSCYVSLFSQLVAGPIIRFGQIEKELENIDKAKKEGKREEGISFFLIGLSKKVLLADSIAMIINPGFLQIEHLGTAETWLLALGYTHQLYFDFSGYSDMAVGLGYFFGIRIPQNFNSPYKAVNVSDFWRRWHMSLSTWLRDYLYIPLGGNTQGSSRTQLNLMITMLLGGLWHGANWTFVLWGGYHGLLLVLHRLYKMTKFPLMSKFPIGLGNFSSRTITFLCVVVGWVLFRCPTLETAAQMLKKMFSLNRGADLPFTAPLLIFLLIASVIAHIAPNTFEMKHRYGTVGSFGFAGLFALCLFCILANESSPFLYFQF